MPRNTDLPRRTSAGEGGWIHDDIYYLQKTGPGVHDYEKGAELIKNDGGDWEIRFTYYDVTANVFARNSPMYSLDLAKGLIDEIMKREWLTNPIKSEKRIS